MGTDALHRSARNTLARLARARMDNDIFRWEPAEVLEILSGIVRMPVCGRQHLQSRGVGIADRIHADTMLMTLQACGRLI